MSGRRLKTTSRISNHHIARMAVASSLALALALPLALVAGLFMAHPASSEDSKTCTLSIEILGLESDDGKLIVALLDDAEAFDSNGKPVRDLQVDISNGKAIAKLDAIPYGTYAIKVFHDENANGELDTNFVGYPKESFGFSLDAMGRFGPPTFEEAKFEIATPEFETTINMM